VEDKRITLSFVLGGNGVRIEVGTVAQNYVAACGINYIQPLGPVTEASVITNFRQGALNF
jgi:hypothetical protein